MIEKKVELIRKKFVYAFEKEVFFFHGFKGTLLESLNILIIKIFPFNKLINLEIIYIKTTFQTEIINEISCIRMKI